MDGLENWNLKWRISRRTANSPLPTSGLTTTQLSGSVSKYLLNIAKYSFGNKTKEKNGEFR